MPARRVPAIPALAALLAAAALAGCAPQSGGSPSSSAPSAAALSGSPAATPSATPTAVPSSAPPPSPAAAQPKPAAPSASRPTPTAVPAPATRLALSVSAPGGRLSLVRGGAAQEFGITLRNGNTRAYGHLVLAFQMEILLHREGDVPASGDAFVLERRDPATGAWRAAPLRIANDALPATLLQGGTPLARDAVRTERFRLRALKAGATGSTPLMVTLVDTDTDSRVGSLSLPATTTRG
ncbi:hypothetical protein [Streptomyces sp. NPDC002054]|uniref:hypothetical protein n=1 Tax=Streptomyces sp. NPDC002054 TaxID=3154663 RepID=UPI003319202C